MLVPHNKSQNHNDVYNLQKPKEEISDSLRQIIQNSSAFSQGNILEELSLFLHSSPNKLSRTAERSFQEPSCVPQLLQHLRSCSLQKTLNNADAASKTLKSACSQPSLSAGQDGLQQGEEGWEQFHLNWHTARGSRKSRDRQKLQGEFANATMEFSKIWARRAAKGSKNNQKPLEFAPDLYFSLKHCSKRTRSF